MRTKFLATVFLLSIVLMGCSRSKFQLDKSEVVWATNHEIFFVETWHTKDTIFGQQIYLVCQKNDITTNKMVLFTVLPEFQESDPSYPRFQLRNGEAVIQDSGTSYVFSIKSRHFITNAWPADVYEGSYTNGSSILSK